jgi:L-aminopeptidase/D-esterase-like protein
VVVDGHRQVVFAVTDFGRKCDALHVDITEVVDGLGHSSKYGRDISLTGSGRIRLGEVMGGPSRRIIRVLCHATIFAGRRRHNCADLVAGSRYISARSGGARRARRRVRDDTDVPSFAIEGVRVGNVTRDGTGVTVVLLPEGSVGSGEVLGGAPATRELDLLDPTRTVARVDAVVFAGGSAFGLAAADGVMRYLAERDQGFATAAGPVPIVPAACIFDLLDASGPPPGADDGYAAAVAAAREDDFATGRVGAGAGAIVGKWRGRDGAVPGGLGFATTTIDGVQVGALAVVNAVGDVVAADGRMLAGSTAPADAPAFPAAQPFEEGRANTTLVVVVTDAALDKSACYLLAQSAHDGFARALRPAHTRFDGDVALAVATATTVPEVEPNLDRLRVAAADVAAEAIRDSVSGR